MRHLPALALARFTSAPGGAAAPISSREIDAERGAPRAPRLRPGRLSLGSILLSVSILASSEAEAAPSLFHDVVADTNPMIWYSFDEGAGDVRNRGGLGASFDGAVLGSVSRQVATPAGDTALSFDTTDAYIESRAVSPLAGNPSFTIEAVVFLSGSANLWGPILHWGDGGGPNNDPERWGREVFFGAQNGNNDRIFAGVYNAGIRTAGSVPTGQWVHLVWTRDGNNDSETGSTLYVNGESVIHERDTDLTSGFPNPGFASAGEIDVLASAFRIHRGRDYPSAGDPNPANQRYFSGALDELALYGYAMSAERVAEHFRALVDATIPPGGFGDSSGSHELVIEVAQ